MIDFVEFVGRLKHWQVFALVVAPMFVLQIYMVTRFPFPLSQQAPASVEEFDALFSQTWLVSLIAFIPLIAWVLAIGYAANRRINDDLRPRTAWLIGCAAYAVGYLAVAQFLWPGLGSSVSGAFVLAIFPLHLLAMVAMIYVFAFVARNLLMAERQSSVAFFDYSGPLFLLWMFPVGVWFVQPRVNSLVARHSECPETCR